MKSNMPTAPRLTENERIVIQWAFNFAHSIVAGNYCLPQPMFYAMKNLQEAVWKLAKDRNVFIADGCSKEYLAFHEGYWNGVEDSRKGRADVVMSNGDAVVRIWNVVADGRTDSKRMARNLGTRKDGEPQTA